MEDKREKRMQANMHQPSQEGNFCDYLGNDVKQTTVKTYSKYIRNINKSDQMAYSCLINQRISK
jgi:hypothetical protein